MDINKHHTQKYRFASKRIKDQRAQQTVMSL